MDGSARASTEALVSGKSSAPLRCPVACKEKYDSHLDYLQARSCAEDEVEEVSVSKALAREGNIMVIIQQLITHQERVLSSMP